MKTIIASLLCCVATVCSHSAQAPSKVSNSQSIGRDEVISVTVSTDLEGSPLLQVSVSQPQTFLDPTFGTRTLSPARKGNDEGRQESGSVSRPVKAGTEPPSLEKPLKPPTAEDLVVRLFTSNGDPIGVVPQDPKGAFFGSCGVGSCSFLVVFKITGADVTAVDRAEVDHAGAKLVFKFRDIAPPSAPTDTK